MRGVIGLGGWSQWEGEFGCVLGADTGSYTIEGEVGLSTGWWSEGRDAGSMEQCAVLCCIGSGGCRRCCLLQGWHCGFYLFAISNINVQYQDSIRGQVVADMLVWLVAEGRTRPWPSTSYSGQCCPICRDTEPASRMLAATSSIPSSGRLKLQRP